MTHIDDNYIYFHISSNDISLDLLECFSIEESNIIKENDVVLVKASRGMHLEKVVEHLNK